MGVGSAAVWLGGDGGGVKELDIIWHGEVNHAFVVIPQQMDATEDLSVQINGEVIVFFEALDEMVSMGLANDFDSKVVDAKVEGDGMDDVAEKSRGVAGGNIAIVGKVLD